MPTQAQMYNRTRASKKATGGRTRKPPSGNPKPPPPPPRNPKPPPPPIARPLKRKQSPPKKRDVIPKGIPAAVYPGRHKMAPFPCPTLLLTHQPNMTDQPTQPTTDITSREILLQTHQKQRPNSKGPRWCGRAPSEAENAVRVGAAPVPSRAW